MFERFKKEGRRLPFALTNFDEDARCEMDAFVSGRRTYFIGLGVYHTRLKIWLDEFGKQRVHVIFTENLESPDDASKELNLLCQFLDIEPYDFSGILDMKFNTSAPIEMKRSVRTDLDRFYLEHNVSLENLLNVKLPWK